MSVKIGKSVIVMFWIDVFLLLIGGATVDWFMNWVIGYAIFGFAFWFLVIKGVEKLLRKKWNCLSGALFMAALGVFNQIIQRIIR